ncbi:MAG: DUF2007 domain-containing protein [Acidobacteriia bacterium]|nr:DUF2007 domain-containing protein [Terriglobia bacterium]
MNEEQHLDHEKLVVVKKVQSEIEANIIKSLLDSAGIQCVLVTQVPHNVYPFTIDGLAEVRIKVLDTDEERAQSIIEAYENAGLEEDDLPA